MTQDLEIPQDTDNPRPTSELKRELFCYYLVTGLTIEEAYEEVGFRPDSGNAYRYYKKKTVQTRLAALRAAIEKRVMAVDAKVWDADTLRKFLQNNAIESRAQGDYAPSNRAIELLGRDRGMFGALAQVGAGDQEALPEADQAAMAATWLEEMVETHQVETIQELIDLLRPSGDTIDNAPYGEYARLEQDVTQDAVDVPASKPAISSTGPQDVVDGQAEDAAGATGGEECAAAAAGDQEALGAGRAPQSEEDAVEAEGAEEASPGDEGGGIPPEPDADLLEGPISIDPRE